MDYLGVDLNSSFKMVDGSGLSYSNKIPTRNLSHIMLQAYRKNWNYSWIKAMPLNCASGSTMRSMFCSGMPSSSFVRAKTGTLGSYKAVKALSGYGFVDGSAKLVFSLIYNGPAGANRQWTVGQPTIEKVVKRALRFAKGFSEMEPTIAGPGDLVRADSSPKLSETLSFDERGGIVKLLQLRLKSYGFYNSAIDGHYGSATEAAVKAFQLDRKIGADGIVGSGTWGYLWPKKEDINWLKAWNVEGSVVLTAMRQSSCAYKVMSNQVPALTDLLERTPKAGIVTYGGEETLESNARRCPDAREYYDVLNGRIIPAPTAVTPVDRADTPVTWHKLYRGKEDKWTIVSYAVDTLVEYIDTKDKKEIINWIPQETWLLGKKSPTVSFLFEWRQPMKS